MPRRAEAEGRTMHDPAALRARLLDLRRDTLHQLAAADTPDAGLMRLVADAHTALAALDAVAEDAAATAPQPRGGDPRATERAQRDAALRRLAALMGADVPTERVARDLAGRLARDRPMPARHGTRAAADARDRHQRPAGARPRSTGAHSPRPVSNPDLLADCALPPLP